RRDARHYGTTFPRPRVFDRTILMDLEDVLYEAKAGVAWITINRPERRNAFRGRTVHDLITCFRAAWHDRDVGVVVLTGAGDKAFYSGGDQKERGGGGYDTTSVSDL